MQSEDGYPYLTDKGKAGLKTIERSDITGVLAANKFNQKMMSLKENEYFYATDFSYNNKVSSAHMYKYKGKPGYSLNKVTTNGMFKTVFVDVNDEAVKPFIREDICLHDRSWFIYKDTLYFASKAYNKILKLSIYYTKEGEQMLMNRRMEYCKIVNSPFGFTRAQLRHLNLIPLYVINV